MERVKSLLFTIIGVGISTTDIVFGLQLLALAVPTGYATWKWRQDYITAKRKSNTSKPSK